MDALFVPGQLDRLQHLLAPNCKFEGPLYQFSNAQAYIDALKSDPPADWKYELLNTFEHEHSACLVYRFQKPGVSTLMTHTFEASDNRLVHIRLIFDSAAFQ